MSANWADYMVKEVVLTDDGDQGWSCDEDDGYELKDVRPFRVWGSVLLRKHREGGLEHVYSVNSPSITLRSTQMTVAIMSLGMYANNAHYLWTNREIRGNPKNYFADQVGHELPNLKDSDTYKEMLRERDRHLKKGK